LFSLVNRPRVSYVHAVKPEESVMEVRRPLS
jgi:hypothetical protein